MVNFKFNKLFIIESLMPADNDLFSPNDTLCGGLDELIQQGRATNFCYERKRIDGGSEQFANYIQSICEECRNGIYPIIHFLGHGRTDEYDEKGNFYHGGIALWNHTKNDNEWLSWNDLYNHLRSVNSLCHNNLFFTTTACHGMDSYRFLYETDSIIPFVGSIAISSKKPFYVTDANKVFPIFYKTLVETNSPSTAESAVDSIVPTLRGKELYVLSSDRIFRNMYKKGLDKIDYSAVSKDDEERIKQEHYIRIRDSKFMFDDPSVERERFDLPDSVNNL